MPGLQFSYRQLQQDIDAIALVARKFVDHSASQVFDELRQQLAAGRRSEAGQPCPLRISPSRPLRTIPSVGEYEPEPRRGKHRIVAEISGVWELAPIGAADTRSIGNRRLELSGNASVLTLIREVDKNNHPYRDLAQWRMEIGADNSPGCYFHISVLGHKDEPPYPASLSVPRFPSFLITIGDALEFALGEVLQTRWSQHAAQETDMMIQWRTSQQHRLERIFAWHKSIIAKEPGAPWAAIKAAKPDPTLLLE